MNTYEFTYEYKEFAEEQEVLGDTLLGAIGNFLEENDLPLDSIVKIELIK